MRVPRSMVATRIVWPVRWGGLEVSCLVCSLLRHCALTIPSWMASCTLSLPLPVIPRTKDKFWAMTSMHIPTGRAFPARPAMDFSSKPLCRRRAWPCSDVAGYMRLFSVSQGLKYRMP
eukprot:15091211-Heterocapsa_arctica.AAC.1